MRGTGYNYRKNFGLLFVFFAFVTLLYFVVIFAARNYTVNLVNNEFTNRKSEVFDLTLVPFNDFFQNRVPEVSFYQGYLDSLEAGKYAYSVLSSYPFVKEIAFYDMLFSNDNRMLAGFSINGLNIRPKTLSIFTINNRGLNKRYITKREEMGPFNEELNSMGIKVASYIDKLQSSSKLTDRDILRVFYSTQPGRITYLNIPRINDLLVYKDIMDTKLDHIVNYEQDMFVFSVDPTLLDVKNIYPNLYERIEVVPIVRAPVTSDVKEYVTEMLLPGALADYKLLFHSSESFISKEVNRSFLPVVLGISLVYLILLVILYLIYRNLEINGRLFKLQYDFINNLTHEFKTPVSVIKIAGNNIKSAQYLSDEERIMYGNILDQESDRLNNLMNKLLSFSQIENKTIKLKREEIDLKTFVDNIVISTQLKHADFKITKEINVKSSLLADPVLLTSVFQNLIDNAYKYSDQKRKVLDIKIQQNKKNFVIIFRDEGIGINKNEFSNIFKKFYRIKSQYNQQGSIGLGLAFCKEITEFMGGEISVKSELGKGTTFTIIFSV